MTEIPPAKVKGPPIFSTVVLRTIRVDTTTTRSSTTRRPHYMGTRHTGHSTPPWTRGEPRTHTSNTKA